MATKQWYEGGWGLAGKLVAGLVLILVLGLLVQTFTQHLGFNVSDTRSSAWASWVQAFGAILAIVGTFALAHSQAHKQQAEAIRKEKEDELEFLMKFEALRFKTYEAMVKAREVIDKDAASFSDARDLREAIARLRTAGNFFAARMNERGQHVWIAFEINVQVSDYLDAASEIVKVPKSDDIKGPWRTWRQTLVRATGTVESLHRMIEQRQKKLGFEPANEH